MENSTDLNNEKLRAQSEQWEKEVATLLMNKFKEWTAERLTEAGRSAVLTVSTFMLGRDRSLSYEEVLAETAEDAAARVVEDYLHSYKLTLPCGME